MNRLKLSEHLYLDEYIPKELYAKYNSLGKLHILVGLIDSRLVQADQMLRNEFGPTVINNWWNGGLREWSGLRLPDTPYYSFTSQHSFGRASDKLYNVPAEQVREYIKKHWKALGITCIEDNVSWVHSDIRYVPRQVELLIVNP